MYNGPSLPKWQPQSSVHQGTGSTSNFKIGRRSWLLRWHHNFCENFLISFMMSPIWLYKIFAPPTFISITFKIPQLIATPNKNQNQHFEIWLGKFCQQGLKRKEILCFSLSDCSLISGVFELWVEVCIQKCWSGIGYNWANAWWCQNNKKYMDQVLPCLSCYAT